MNNQTHVNNPAYNQFIIDHVVDFDGSKYEVQCQSCSETAIKHKFEDCHTGSLNQYYTLNCEHCGYHSCNQDACSECDADYESRECEIERRMSYTLKLNDIVKIALDDYLSDFITTKAFDSIRKMVYQDEFDIDFEIFYFTDSKVYKYNFMTYLLIAILDIRFERWLEQRIELAKCP